MEGRTLELFKDYVELSQKNYQLAKKMVEVQERMSENEVHRTVKGERIIHKLGLKPYKDVLFVLSNDENKVPDTYIVRPYASGSFLVRQVLS